MRLVVTAGSGSFPVEVVEREGGFRVRLGEEWVEVDAQVSAVGAWSLLIDGISCLADVREEGGEVVVTVNGAAHRLRVEEPGRGRRVAATGAVRDGGQRLVAPMPGKVVAIHVRPGDRVEPGTPLVVLEAMKMENEFRAASAGVITEVLVAPGEPVNAGDVLVVIGPGEG